MLKFLSSVGSIFSGSGLAKNIMSGIDKSFFTIEEQKEQFEKMLPLYAPFNVAQRAIAVPAVYIFLFLVLLLAVCSLFGLVPIERISETVGLLSKLWYGEIMGLVFGFYLGGGASFFKK